MERLLLQAGMPEGEAQSLVELHRLGEGERIKVDDPFPYGRDGVTGTFGDPGAGMKLMCRCAQSTFGKVESFMAYLFGKELSTEESVALFTVCTSLEAPHEMVYSIKTRPELISEKYWHILRNARIRILDLYHSFLKNPNSPYDGPALWDFSKYLALGHCNISLGLKYGMQIVVAGAEKELAQGECCVCEKRGNNKICSHCGAMAYCSVQCQKKDWPKHKPFCKLFRRGRTEGPEDIDRFAEEIMQPDWLSTI
jgi:hypothetical protein